MGGMSGRCGKLHELYYRIRPSCGLSGPGHGRNVSFKDGMPGGTGSPRSSPCRECRPMEGGMKIGFSSILKWFKRNGLPTSVLANVLLVVMIVMLDYGWTFSYEGGNLEIKQTISPEAHVAALFRDDLTRAQARG